MRWEGVVYKTGPNMSHVTIKSSIAAAVCIKWFVYTKMVHVRMDESLVQSGNAVCPLWCPVVGQLGSSPLLSNGSVYPSCFEADGRHTSQTHMLSLINTHTHTHSCTRTHWQETIWLLSGQNGGYWTIYCNGHPTVQSTAAKTIPSQITSIATITEQWTVSTENNRVWLDPRCQLKVCIGHFKHIYSGQLDCQSL